MPPPWALTPLTASKSRFVSKAHKRAVFGGVAAGGVAELCDRRMLPNKGSFGRGQCAYTVGVGC
jgi:hypothetical protein